MQDRPHATGRAGEAAVDSEPGGRARGLRAAAKQPSLGVLALQRSAGNAAVTAMMGASASASAAVPGGSGAASLLGPLASDVRVHRGPPSDARLADRPDALAVTEGTDIHVASRAPALDSPSGRLLLAHEAAHVVQQSRGGPASTDELAETEADEAAVAASVGRSVTVQAAAHGPQFFEAPKHQATLTTAMAKSGFTDAEQQEAYFGNWCRDLSQALVPVLDETIGHNGAFALVNMMSIRHFGHGVTPAQLGAYAPVEHIDNPAGTTDKDILAEGSQKIAGYSDSADPLTGTPENVAQAGNREDLKPENIAKSFEVSAGGVPAYINRSKEYVLTEFGLAVKEGRTAAGLYHLGNFSHTCEDLFAHSNWIEMAFGRLIKENAVQIPPEVKADVEQRKAEGRPPIEDYAAQAFDKAGNARPILATGTFTGASATGTRKGHDTLISLSEEVKNVVAELDPFKEESKGASQWDFLMEILNHMDAAGDDGTLGPIMLGVLEPLVGTIDELAKKATSGVDSLEGDARKTFGKGTLGDVAAGAAGLLGKGVHSVIDPAAGGATEGMKKLILAAANTIGHGGVSLAQLAVWYQKGEGAIADAWKSLKDGVKALPTEIVALILPKLIEAERAFKKAVHDLGSALYDKATRKLLAGLGRSREETHVEDTNVDEKYHAWAQELSTYMKIKLVEVGGPEVQKLADEIPSATGKDKAETEEHISKLVVYGEQTFPGLIVSLAKTAEAAAIAEEASKKGGGQAHQVAQLQNVPEWARAGASHSQISKDHATSPFFGVAFNVANVADTTLVALLKEAWGAAGPAPGLDKNFGEKDASGQQKMAKADPGEQARPELKDEKGLSDWEKEARKKFLENRKEGEDIEKQGLVPAKSIGTALTTILTRLRELVRAYPVLGPMVDRLEAKARANPEQAELVKAIEEAERQFDEYAKSGKLDDDLMKEVDHLLARAKTIVTSEEDHHEGEGDIHSQKQIDLLDQHRGTGPDGKKKGVELDSVNKAVKVGEANKLDAAVAAANTPQEKFKMEIERIFAHPYDSNWWVPTVQDWAKANQQVLGEYIRERNAGKSEIH
jgi:Heterokaryon incompatibility protein Het-C/Domain of unknown function (DUF4157)